MLRKIIASIVLLTIVCLTMFVVWSSSSFYDCVKRQQSAYSQETKEKMPPLLFARGSYTAICLRCTGHVVYEYRDAATAAATIFIAFFTFTLWGATIKLANADRPHIFPGHFSITGMKTNGIVEIGFNFENCGRSPAYLKNIVIACWAGAALPAQPTFENADTKEIPFALAPGKVFFPAGNARADISVPQIVRAEVLKGGKTFFVYGCVNFVETGRTAHFQRFAYRYAPASDDLVNCGPSSYWDHS